MPSDPTALLVTGVFGAGKSSVVEEMADMLERAGSSYAALDLDWLWWFDAEALDRTARRRVLMTNVAAVAGTYQEVGVDRLLMAWAAENRDDVDALALMLERPLHVVRLVVPMEVIAQRLSSSATTGRNRDLEVAARWIAAGVGADIGDVEFDGDRPVRHVAGDILRWLGWT